MNFQHNNINITINPTPNINGHDFGLAFAPQSAVDHRPIFLLVIKCPFSPRSDEDVQTLYSIGKQLLINRLDAQNFEHRGYYCYLWDAFSGSVKEVDCEVISPRGVRSPDSIFTHYPPTKNSNTDSQSEY